MNNKQDIQDSNILMRSKMIIASLAAYAATAFFLPQGYSPILYTLTGFAVIQNAESQKYSDTEKNENETIDRRKTMRNTLAN